MRRPVGRPRRVTCRRCERNVAVCGPLSARGFCQRCGIGGCIENAIQLHEHRGPRFEHWRRQCVAAFGAIMVEDL